ncbi:MAG: DUF4097 family beta strand repeat-containing protein [Clostridia bacterium]
MKRKAYLDELDKELGFLPTEERQEIVREFSSHIDEAMARNPGHPEEELIERLPLPAVFSVEFRSGTPAGNGYSQGFDESGASVSDEPAPTGPDESKARFKRFFRYTGGEPKEMSRQFDGVQRVEIRSMDADIHVVPGAGFSCHISGTWDDDTEPELELNGSILRMDLGSAAEKAELVLPEDLAEFLARTSSGDVRGSLCADASAIVHSSSGDIDLVVQNGTVRVSSSSGGIQIKGCIGSAEVKTASGNIRLIGLHDTLKASSASGDLYLVYTGTESDSAISTASGDVWVELPPEAVPGIRAYSVSGDLTVPAATVDRRPGRKSCTRDGGPGMLKISTLSGDIRIE